MSIKLYENFRSIMYTPFYLAIALGAYDKEGVLVEMQTSPNLPETTAGLLAGKVDVSWGGPLRVLLDYDRNQNSDLVAFCEVNMRDPFILVGRTPNPTFEFSDLVNLKVATVSEAPTPWICLSDDIRNAGIDPQKLNRIGNCPVEDNIRALCEGKIDVVQLFEPYVEILSQEGSGHIWYASAARGYTSYTAFFTSRKTANVQKDNLLKMTRAMYRTQKWLYGHDSNEAAELVASFFPEIPLHQLSGAIKRYKILEIWGHNPILKRQGFDRLKSAMLSSGSITHNIPYENCVDTSFAEQVILEDPPAI